MDNDSKLLAEAYDSVHAKHSSENNFKQVFVVILSNDADASEYADEDDMEQPGFGGVFSSEAKAHDYIKEGGYGANANIIQLVWTGYSNAAVLEYFQPDHGSWMYEGIYPSVPDAKDASGYADEERAPDDVHIGTVTIDSPNQNTGSKSYGLKRRFTDSQW